MARDSSLSPFLRLTQLEVGKIDSRKPTGPPRGSIDEMLSRLVWNWLPPLRSQRRKLRTE